MTDYPVAQFRLLNATTDLPRLQALHDVCFPVKYDDRYYNWLSSSRCIGLVAVVSAEEAPHPPLPDGARSHPEGSATERDVVIGFVIGKIKYVEGPLLMNPVVYIATFGVDPGLQGRGIGHQLLERFVGMVSDAAFLSTPPCADFAFPASGWSLRAVLNRLVAPKPMSQIWLHCLANDSHVIHFYSKRNFLVVERIPSYYDFNGEVHDALVMVREVVREDPQTSGARKGNRKGTTRAWQSRTIWDVLCGTTPAGALEGQDDLEDDSNPPSAAAAAFCGLGRKISNSGWCVAGALATLAMLVCLLSMVLRMRNHDGPTTTTTTSDAT